MNDDASLLRSYADEGSEAGIGERYCGPEENLAERVVRGTVQASMIRWFLLISLLLSSLAHTRAADAVPAQAEPPIPPLLLAALTKLSQDFDRWAYTETRNGTDRNGNPLGETIVRFDPSKPYEAQFTPLKVNGHEPTEKDRATYRKQGVKRGEQLMKEEAEGRAPAEQFGRFRLNGDIAAIDLARATVESETEKTVTYNVPLRRDPKNTLPVEKIELIARINKERQALENVALRLKDSFRMKLVLNVKSGAGNIDFTVVDPKYVPVVSSASGEGVVSVMFVKFGGAFDWKRTEFQRVKPFGDRFGVKIGPMKALDF